MESTQNTQSTKNVPGAFSSNKGRDFHAVLEALCSVCDDAVSIPEPYDKANQSLFGTKQERLWETIIPSHGEHLTLNTGECPNVARESTLSQILQADAPEKYYLSPRKACEGICRRAMKRGNSISSAVKSTRCSLRRWGLPSIASSPCDGVIVTTLLLCSKQALFALVIRFRIDTDRHRRSSASRTA